MSSTNYPTVGIASLTFNDAHLIEDCLKSIRNQDYPQELISTLFVDGGSTDNTVAILKQYGAGIIERPDLKLRADQRVELMMSSLKTDIVVMFSADCRFNEPDCLRKMVEALTSEADLVGVQTQKYAIRPEDPPLSRYLSLIGGVDPIAVGLQKADRTPYDIDEWHSSGVVTDRDFFFKVAFSQDIAKLPAIGANGFAIKRVFLEEVGGMKNGGHADMCARLIRQGHNTFGFLKGQHIVHYIDISLWAFLKRRLSWATLYAGDKIERDYSVMTKRDLLKLVWIILTYSTLIFPLLRAIRGHIKKPDSAWFMHPIVCFAFFASYSLLYGLKPISWLQRKTKL